MVPESETKTRLTVIELMELAIILLLMFSWGLWYSKTKYLSTFISKLSLYTPEGDFRSGNLLQVKSLNSKTAPPFVPFICNSCDRLMCVVIRYIGYKNGHLVDEALFCTCVWDCTERSSYSEQDSVNSYGIKIYLVFLRELNDCLNDHGHLSKGLR